MKALSLLQPWAEAVLFLGKNIENRKWPTNHRGPLIVHCSKGWDGDGEKWITKNWKKVASQYPADPSVFFAAARLRRGCFAGITDVLNCVPHDELLLETPWAFGPFCWLLANTTTCQVFEGPGQLGLFNFEGGLLSADGKVIVQSGVKL